LGEVGDSLPHTPIWAFPTPICPGDRATPHPPGSRPFPSSFPAQPFPLCSSPPVPLFQAALKSFLHTRYFCAIALSFLSPSPCIHFLILLHLGPALKHLATWAPWGGGAPAPPPDPTPGAPTPRRTSSFGTQGQGHLGGAKRKRPRPSIPVPRRPPISSLSAPGSWSQQPGGRPRPGQVGSNFPSPP
jgi:hypothetical protein